MRTGTSPCGVGRATATPTCPEAQMSPIPPGRPPFGPLVARSRRARGWSQSRLAAELCAAAGVPTVSRHEISRWERQVREPGSFWRGWLVRVLAAPAVQPAAPAARRTGPAARPTGRASAGGPGPAAKSGTATGPGGSPRPARRAPARPRPAADPTRRRAGGSSWRTSTH
ncbi:helix-turn-helix transcriptional regulator [Micromonospora sp. NPDC049891]|uniref:helix-turn-helix domain-containing protein n=1 Tax=Micromonospora sp. NPDC049891 TaxID=3155655 RepID=UPI00340493B3